MVSATTSAVRSASDFCSTWFWRAMDSSTKPNSPACARLRANSLPDSEGSLKTPADAVAFALRHYVQPDVLVLGMGGDGHTASIFPQAPQFADTVRPDYPQPLLHTSPITAPHERISMTLAAIVATPHVYLAIAGAEKRRVYDAAAQAQTAQYPISYVLHSQKVNAHVFYND